jgi:Zn-dependent metalloprotease
MSCIQFTAFCQNDTLLVEKNSAGILTFASFKQASEHRKLSQGVGFLKKTFKTSEHDEFRLHKQERDDLGIDHLTYQQYLLGIRVEGGIYKIHGRADAIKSMNGNFEKVYLKEQAATVTESSALELALARIGASKYVWQDVEFEESLRSSTGDSKATNYPKGELVIKRESTGKQEWRIAWRFQISALDPISAQNIWIDATRLEVIAIESLSCNANVQGTAQTRYSGTRNIITDSFTYGYRLRENRSGVDVQTLNLFGGDINNLNNAQDFLDPDANNNWTAAEFNNQEDQAALDLHWGVESILDYWRTQQARNSFDGNSLRVISYANFGTGQNNAFWYGGSLKIMAFGDGGSWQPVTALDVVAHEFGHGINEFESGLGGTGEGGALNEGLSDIWGAVIENWAAPEKNHWVMGEDISGGIRFLNNPKSLGYPNTYGGQYWISTSGCSPTQQNDWCGVHINSSVLTYMFYLLSDGGSGTNDNGSCYNVTSIGIVNAAKIAYRAEQYYINSSSLFPDVRSAMIQAASDLYGPSSIHVSSVTNAWYAVGVGSASHTSGDISGNEVCAPGATINLSNSTSNVTWVVSPSNLFITSSGTGTSAFLQPVIKASGPATITFTPTAGCGTSNAVSKSLWVGKPKNNFSGPTSVYPDQIYTYTAAESNNFNWVWTLSPGVGDCGITYGGNCFFGSGGGGQNFTIVWMHESGYLRLNSSNACGAGPQKSIYITVTTQGGCNPCQISSIYPNPSSTELNIKLKVNDDKDKKNEPTEVKLIDSYQTTLYSAVVTEPFHKIDTAGLPEGIYYVVVTNSQGTETKRVVVGH